MIVIPSDARPNKERKHESRDLVPQPNARFFDSLGTTTQQNYKCFPTHCSIRSRALSMFSSELATLKRR